jgi:hypothetical protein
MACKDRIYCCRADCSFFWFGVHLDIFLFYWLGVRERNVVTLDICRRTLWPVLFRYPQIIINLLLQFCLWFWVLISHLNRTPMPLQHLQLVLVYLSFNKNENK